MESESLHAELMIAKRTLHGTKSISAVLDKLKPLQQCFTSLWTLMQLALTFPVSNAKCERSFSVLKLVKTHLRATMGQERLTSLGTISIEKSVIDALDLDAVVDKFATLPISVQTAQSTAVSNEECTVRRLALL